MDRLKTPTLSEAIQGQQKAVTEKITSTIENEDLTMYMPLAEELLEKYDAKTLAATVLKLMTKEPDNTPVKLTGEAPVFAKKDRKFSSGKQRNGRAFNRSDNGRRRNDRGRNNDRRNGRRERSERTSN